jgi:hypothetical protein
MRKLRTTVEVSQSQKERGLKRERRIFAFDTM